jgi:hypothetical protein
MTEDFDKSNPFSVPDGYFDGLQEKIMDDIRKDEQPVFRIKPYYKYIAAAACVLLISTFGFLWWTNQQSMPIANNEENMAQWMDVLDRTSLMAAILDIEMPEETLINEPSEEQEREIIRFLEHENITIVAIVHAMDNDVFN